MIIKKISCEVKENYKEAFFEQQKQWKPVSKMKGFLGQIGGWNIKQPLTASIYSFWENKTDYEQFMKEEHYQIYESTGQENSYQSIDVSLFQEMQSVPGKEDNIVQICRNSKYIRVTMAQVKEDNTEQFVDKQRKVWNTRMQQSEGMLGGTL
jgi:quinol monooxygenase YgiN